MGDGYCNRKTIDKKLSVDNSSTKEILLDGKVFCYTDYLKVVKD